jgi:Protein of unknown function (DUF3485)
VQAVAIGLRPGLPVLPNILEVSVTIMTLISLRPPMSAPAEASRRPADTRVARSPWAWLAITCLLLGVSGGVRFWREWNFSALAVESAACPFPLADLPRTMGTWQATDAEVQLDPEVARFAGASEHIMRGYLDQKTGDQASALVLYGVAVAVSLHVPEVCYPAAGYQLFRGPVDRTIEVPGVKGPIRYRWAIYTRRVGGLDQYEEVCHSFYHDGEWLAEASDRWKTFRYHPSLFKVQIAHPISELREDNESPALSLLTEFVRRIGERLSPARSGGPAAPAATGAPEGR